MAFRPVPFAAALAALLALPALPAAQEGQSGCYRQILDASELRAEPDRMITEIAIGPAGPITGNVMPLLFEVRTRDSDERFLERAECRDGLPLVCHVEGEQGSFTLEPAAGGVLLRPGEHGASLFGSAGAVSLWPDGGPDSSFLLAPVGPDLCPEAG